MAEKKHTRGPWRTRKGFIDCIEIYPAIRVPVGQPTALAEVGCDYPEWRENVALIKNAPTLLKAAQQVLAGLNARIDAASAAGEPVPVFDGIAELHAAIVKARGTQQ